MASPGLEFRGRPPQFGPERPGTLRASGLPPLPVPGHAPIPPPSPQGSQSQQEDGVIIPPVEPPAPMSSRFLSPAARRKWLSERFQEVPCWLSSMVVHLAAFIVFGSLITQATERRVATLQLVWATGAEPDDCALTSPRSVRIRASILPIDKNDRSSSGDDPVQVEPVPNEDEQQDAQDEDVEQPAPPELGRFTEKVTDVSNDRPQDELPAYPLPPARLVPQAMRAAEFGSPHSVSTKSLRKTHPATQKPAFDRIVDRFIEYDIGNLTGQPGQLAYRRFQTLGPESIPALVRGLNRAAGIRASCPIGVISRKLQIVASQTDDQALIDYAIENIGRDVPASAPHLSRILSLRDQFNSSRIVLSFPRARGVPTGSRKEWVTRLRELQNAPATRYDWSLRSSNPVDRSAAQAALAMKPPTNFTLRQRVQLARLLISQIRGSALRGRVGIDEALQSLAKGTTARPPSRDLREQRKLMRQWGQWWDQFEAAARGDRDTIGALTRAQEYERQGRWSEALVLYRTVADDAGSRSAVQARRRLGRLEEQGFIVTE